MPEYTIGVGTVGAGLWFSYDGGGRWRHIYKHLNPEGNVRAIKVDPNDPHHVLAASDHTGLFQSHDNGYIWEPLNLDLNESEIWSLEIDPSDSETVYVGARPGGHKSTDGGATATRMDMGIGDECPIGVPRTTNMVLDPRDANTLWAGVEVDGIYRSRDKGETWEGLDDIGPTPFHGDIHGLAVQPTKNRVFASTPFGMATSVDDGASWNWREFDGFGIDKGSGNPFAYCRGVFVSPTDPDTVLLGCGDYIPGQVGAIEVSHDAGETFDRVDMSDEPNSTVYWMAMHPELPDTVVAATVFGQVFVSESAGDSWTKLDREFGEIRSVSLAPNG